MFIGIKLQYTTSIYDIFNSLTSYSVHRGGLLENEGLISILDTLFVISVGGLEGEPFAAPSPHTPFLKSDDKLSADIIVPLLSFYIGIAYSSL